MASVSARPADAGASSEDANNSRPAASDHAPAVRFGPALRFLLPVTLVVLVFDQLTKIWAVDRLGDGNVIDLFWTARFNLVYNDGAAFSVGSQFTIFISIAAIVISVGVIAFSPRVHEPSVLAAMGLVLGGALGNLIDRIVRDGNGFLRGAVVDFIDFQWWPVFNIADIAIVCGGILLVFLVSERSKTPTTVDAESAQAKPGADNVGTVGADPTDTSL